jgi:hypothetical protein
MRKPDDFLREEVKKKVLLFDLETSFCLGYCWGKYEQTIAEFEKHSRLLGFAYQWLGEDETLCFIEKDFKTNKQLVRELWKLLDEADVIVAHNNKNFDYKKANTFFIHYDMKPPSPFEVVDTLYLIKKYAKFEDNHLDGLGDRLFKDRKTMMPEKLRLWVKYTNKTATSEEWEELRTYAKQDIKLLKDLYLRVRPYDTNHKAIYINDKGVCPLCGSSKIQSSGWSTIIGGTKRRRFQCQDCGKWSSSLWAIRFADRDGIIK